MELRLLTTANTVILLAGASKHVVPTLNDLLSVHFQESRGYKELVDVKNDPVYCCKKCFVALERVGKVERQLQELRSELLSKLDGNHEYNQQGAAHKRSRSLSMPADEPASKRIAAVPGSEPPGNKEVPVRPVQVA